MSLLKNHNNMYKENLSQDKILDRLYQFIKIITIKMKLQITIVFKDTKIIHYKMKNLKIIYKDNNNHKEQVCKDNNNHKEQVYKENNYLINLKNKKKKMYLKIH